MNNRLGVMFRGGALIPHHNVTSNSKRLENWNICFGKEGHMEAKAQDSLMTTLFQSAMELIGLHCIILSKHS